MTVRPKLLYEMRKDLLVGLNDEITSEFLATDTEVSGSIPGATRFFWVVVGLERGLLSLVRWTEELLE